MLVTCKSYVSRLTLDQHESYWLSCRLVTDCECTVYQHTHTIICQRDDGLYTLINECYDKVDPPDPFRFWHFLPPFTLPSRSLNFLSHQQGASACGGSRLPAPFKIKPWSPGSLNYFLNAPQINFQCSLNYFLLSPCSLKNFCVAPYLISFPWCSLEFFLCSLLPKLVPLLPAP